MNSRNYPELSLETGSAISSVMYEIQVKYEPYYVEYHTDQEFVKLPRGFNIHHIHNISPKVMLCDPAGNVFQVAVEIKDSEAMFTVGWNAVGKFYGLNMGGTVRLVFAGSEVFMMQLKDRVDRNVHYPLPARFSGIGVSPILVGDFQKEAITNHCDYICRRADFFCVITKDLTAEEICSGFLHIPQDFCKVAFRKSGLPICVFDEYGFQTTCIVEFDAQNPTLSGLTEGWEKVSNHRKFFEGLRLEIAVPVGNPHLMAISTVNYHVPA